MGQRVGWRPALLTVLLLLAGPSFVGRWAGVAEQRGRWADGCGVRDEWKVCVFQAKSWRSNWTGTGKGI